MNNVEITYDVITPGVTQMDLYLTSETEATFKQIVFPFLFDGKTSGIRSQSKGRAHYRLLVYNLTLVVVFKQALVNAILVDNGQMN